MNISPIRDVRQAIKQWFPHVREVAENSYGVNLSDVTVRLDMYDTSKFNSLSNSVTVGLMSVDAVLSTIGFDDSTSATLFILLHEIAHAAQYKAGIIVGLEADANHFAIEQLKRIEDNFHIPHGTTKKFSKHFGIKRG